MLEQNVAIDDNLLPSAIELEKLKEVDPSIIQWIMNRADFVIKGLPVTGSIFGGTAIISAVVFFVKASTKPKE